MDTNENSAMQEQRLRLEALADELMLAAKHAREAAEHIHKGEVPRFAAHTLAALGHVRKAEEGLNEVARAHSDKAGF